MSEFTTQRFAQVLAAAVLLACHAGSSRVFGQETDPYAPPDLTEPMPADTPAVAEEVAAPCGQPDCRRCCMAESDTLLGDFEKTYIDGLFDAVGGWKNRWNIPVGAGAYHWFHVDASGDNNGYGIEGLRGTYWWYVTADPELDLGDGRKVGGHLEYRLRDGDFFRSFFDSKFWSYEAYLYYQTPELGTLKAGQIWKRFGLDWDGVFFGNVPYFDGFKLDPDYGVSWEKTTELDDAFKVDSFVQFYFHEDGVNGSFEGADAESVPGYNERNTGVVRVVPTWTLCDNSTLALGLSGLVGEIDSSRPGLDDEVTSAWAADMTYTNGPWKLFGEVMQSFGTINPTRYVSGGPSNRITDMLVGAHYTIGPVTLRTSYSHGWDDNPAAHHEMVVAGTTIKMTENVDFYFEYVNEQVHGNAFADRIEFFDSFQFVVNWHY